MGALNQILLPSAPWIPSNSQPLDPLRKSKLHDEIKSSLLKLSTSKFYKQFLSQFRSPQIQTFFANLGPEFEFVIYGIGSVESEEDSRLQIALALLLCRELDTRILSVHLFDPILSLAECTVLEELGFAVMRTDECGRREVKVATLFFMPHCDVTLYENLLAANWSSERLKKIAILGNSFGQYMRNVENFFTEYSTRLEDVAPMVMMASKFDTEVEMDGVQKVELDDFSLAFYYTSWHFFELDDGCNLNEYKLELATEGIDKRDTIDTSS